MILSIKEHLLKFTGEINIDAEGLQLPDAVLDNESIKVMMINEVPPGDPDDFFYSRVIGANYMKTTLSLFKNAGIEVNSIDEILQMGIYITTAVKVPKKEYTVDSDIIAAHLPFLEKEIGMFPNLKVIMLMGDVAKKAFNMIAKKKTKKNAIPSGSTYKIRKNEFYFEGIRLFPSYIMTGGNILIEKSKCEMISDDIQRMMLFI